MSKIRESKKSRENLTSNLEFCDVAKKDDPKFRQQLTTQIYVHVLFEKFIFDTLKFITTFEKFYKKNLNDIFASSLRVYSFFSKLFKI